MGCDQFDEISLQVALANFFNSISLDALIKLFDQYVRYTSTGGGLYEQ